MATTPNMAVPYVVGADTVTSYPTTSQQLATGLDIGSYGTVPRFATTAARDAAITAPTDGMLAWTADTRRTWEWAAGVGWIPMNATCSAAGTQTNVPASETIVPLTGLTGDTVAYAISSGQIQVKVAGVYLVHYGFQVSVVTANTVYIKDTSYADTIVNLSMTASNMAAVCINGSRSYIVTANGLIGMRSFAGPTGATHTTSVRVVRIGS